MSNDTDSPALLAIGECMMELSNDGDGFRRAFAGDTYNAAVYAKRQRSELDVQFLTTVGSDPVSEALLEACQQQGLDTALISRSPDRVPGIYLISTDAAGERSFTYWRKESAATELVRRAEPTTRERLSQFGMLYLSGITLAILSDADRETLLSWLALARDRGSQVAFDPNYRPALWGDPAKAAHWITRAYEITDMAFPGLQDHQLLFRHDSAQEIWQALQHLSVHECIVKAEDSGMLGFTGDGQTVQVPRVPGVRPVDTTGAGDAFAGTYLAERLSGGQMASAMATAARVASVVVEHPGAILPAAVYSRRLAKG